MISIGTTSPASARRATRLPAPQEVYVIRPRSSEHISPGAPFLGSPLRDTKLRSQIFRAGEKSRFTISQSSSCCRPQNAGLAARPGWTVRAAHIIATKCCGNLATGSPQPEAGHPVMGVKMLGHPCRRYRSHVTPCGPRRRCRKGRRLFHDTRPRLSEKEKDLTYPTPKGKTWRA